MDIFDYTSRGQLHMVLVYACCCAMACFTLSHVSTESDRQIDLSYVIARVQHAL